MNVTFPSPTTTRAASGGPDAHPRQTGVLFAMCLALTLVVASVSALNLGLPEIATSLQATNTDLTWIADGYTVALAAFVLPFGALGDRYGRRKLLITGCLVFGGASFVAGTVDSPSHLIACRVAMGLGAALIMPGTLSTITATFSDDERPKGVAIWSGFAAAGAVIGLLAAGALLQRWGWESIFHASAIVALVTAAAAVLLAPETKDDDAPPFDVPGSALLALSIGTLVYGIIEGAEKGWTTAIVIAAFAVCLVAAVTYVVVGLRRAHPLLDPRLFRNAGFSTGAVTILTQFMAVFGFFYVGLQYLQLVLDHSALESALALVPVAVVVLPVSRLTPRLTERFDSRIVSVTGLLLLAAGMGWLTTLDVDSGYWPFLAGLVVAGLGIGVTSSTGTTSIVSSLPSSEQGVASAMNDATREIGSAVGIALMGAVYATTYRDTLPDLSRLPAPARELTHDSAPGGIHVAASLPAQQGAPMRAGVESAFMTGLTHALAVVAVILVVAALVVLVFAPRKDAVPHEHEHAHTRVPLHVVAAAFWLAVDLGAMALLVMTLWVFPPASGVLPEPTWFVDPLAGWVVGTVLGIALYRVLLERTPWFIASVSLVLVALAPIVFAAYPALGAFVSGAIIGCAAGGLFWRAHRNAHTTLI